jgi:zinc protease
MTATLLTPKPIIPLNCPTIHYLPNGATIIAEQMPVEAVNLSVWLNVGSANEYDHINGMAHFLEHMVFKGTNNLKIGEFEKIIEERGAITNAGTSQDYTQYYVTTAPKDFSTLAPLQLDVVLNPSIPDDAFAKEKLVVLEEIRRSQDNPRRRTFQKAMELAFNNLPYQRPVLGPVEVVENLTAKQMRDFHSQWYQPANITAVAVGNLPVDYMIDTIAQSLEKQQIAQEFSTEITYQSETPFTNIVRQEYIDESITQARLIMMWRVPGLLQLHDSYPLDIITGILGHGRTSRLVKDLREDQHLVQNIAVSNITNKLQGLFYISAQLPIENIEKVEAAILEHIHKLHREPVTKAEIARVRTQVANRFIFANETPSDRANVYGYYHAMIRELAPALNYPARIQALEAIDLQIAAQKYLSNSAYGVLIVKPKA